MRDSRGSATIWMVTALALVWVIAATVTLAGGVRAARHRAQAAADLGALSAARAVMSGAEDACAVAAVVVRRNGARLRRCVVRNDTVTLDVAVGLPDWIPGRPVAHARARAGPADRHVSRNHHNYFGHIVQQRKSSVMSGLPLAQLSLCRI